MPIYEYLCNNCRRRFEYLLRKTDEKVSCPYCKAEDLKRLFSPFSFGGKRDSSGNFKSSSKCSGCMSSNCSSCV